MEEVPSLSETAAEVEVVSRDEVDEDFEDEPNWEGGTEYASSGEDGDDDEVVESDEDEGAAGPSGVN